MRPFHRLAALYWSGGCFNLSDSILALAVPWLVLQATGSVMLTGLVASAALGAMLAGSLLSGAMVRRLGADKTIQLSFLSDVIGISGLLYCFMQPSLPIWLLIFFVVIDRSLDAACNVAVESRFPEVARYTKTPLARISAMKESLMIGSLIIGTASAGWMLANFSTVLVLSVSLALNVTGIITFQLILALYRSKSVPANSGIRKSFGYLWGQKHLRSYLILVAVVMASIASVDDVILPALIDQTTKNPEDIGWIMASYGVTALISALLYAAYHHHISNKTVVTIGILGIVIFFAALALPFDTEEFLIATMICGLMSGALGPMIDTKLLTDTPSEHRLSMLAATNALGIGSAPLMIAVHAFIIERYSIEILAAGLAIFLLVALLLPYSESSDGM